MEDGCLFNIPIVSQTFKIMPRQSVSHKVVVCWDPLGDKVDVEQRGDEENGL